MQIKTPFSRKSYSGKSTNVSSERMVNLYSETPETTQLVFYPSNNTSARSPVYYNFPGLKSDGTFGADPALGTRCQIVHNGKLYIVVGNILYSKNTSGTILNEFTAGGYFFPTSVGMMSVASNGSFGNQLAFVDGVTSAVFVWNSSTGVFVTQALPAGLLSGTPIVPTHITYMDGYFIINEKGFGQFYLSAPYDGLVWSTIFSANAERDPDNIVALANTFKELYLIGETTTEIWYNSGNVVPFDPIPNLSIERGTIAPFSVNDLEGVIFMLSKSKAGALQVIAFSGGNETVLSTPPVEYSMSKYSTPEDATAQVLKVNNHAFYILSFHAAKKTWIYDLAEKTWGELESYDPINIMYNKWRSSFATFFNNKVHCGSKETNTSFVLDEDTFVETVDSLPNRQILLSQVFESDRIRLFFSDIEIYMEHGLAPLEPALGFDPELQLEWSDDGGKTWDGPIYEKYGKTGEYLTMVRFSALGSSYNRIFRLTNVAYSKFTIVGVYVNISKGTG